MIQSFINRSFTQLLTLFLLFSLVLFKLSGVIMYIDSYGYIENHIIRSAVYPLFLDFLSFDQSHTIVVFIQMFLTAFSLSYFAKLNKFIFENVWIYCAYMVFGFIIIGNFSNAVISEALAIPFFIFFLSKFILILKSEYTTKTYIETILWLTVIISIRNQFVFLLPVFALALLIVKPRPAKKIYFVGLLIPILLNTIVDRTYHQFKHNHFIATPYTGMQILPSVLFNAHLSDSVIFTDKNERKDFVYLKQQLLDKYIDHQKMDTILGNSPQYLFTVFFDVIAHRTIKPYYLDQLKHLNQYDQYVTMDEKGKHMYFLLFKKNLKSNVLFYFNLIRLNGYNNWLIFIIFVFVILFTLFHYLKFGKWEFLLIFISLTALLMNQSLVTLVNIIGYRYVVYNYIFIFYVMLHILNQSTLNLKSQN